MSSINERILKIIEHFHENSVENFAELTNIPVQQVRKLLQVSEETKRYPRPSYKIQITILKTYPNLYSNWFLSGKEEMLLKEVFEKLCIPIEKQLQAQIEKRDKAINTLLMEMGRLPQNLSLRQTKK